MPVNGHERRAHRYLLHADAQLLDGHGLGTGPDRADRRATYMANAASGGLLAPGVLRVCVEGEQFRVLQTRQECKRVRHGTVGPTASHVSNGRHEDCPGLSAVWLWFRAVQKG